MKPNLIVLILFVLLSVPALAQVDSTLEALQDIPLKYISSIDKKIDKYGQRISSKTIKTLEKLSRWEAKVHSTLQKLSPGTAEQLFGNGQLTFSSLLQQVKQGEAVALQYRQEYDQYRDQLTTGLKYVEQQKDALDSGVIKKIAATRQKMQELNKEEDQQAAIQQFIKERKKQLITTSFQWLGKNKYLSKMNKEVFYYGETMKNYKELFRDEKKAEQTAKTILNKIPAFRKFIQKNSMLSQLFGQQGDEASAASLAGLQTRASIQSLLQDRVGSGINTQELVSQNMQSAQSQLSQMRDKLLKKASGNDTEIPAYDFKPKTEKTKSFLQRVEFGSNIQMGKTNSLMPATMDLALTVGYRINDKSTVGIGAGYKLGMGTIDNIQLSNQGMSLRSFIDWKLKKQLFISGGMEMNYLSSLPVADPLHEAANTSNWQQAALLGLTKKVNLKTKWSKETKLQLMYDFLAKQHVPVSQPVVFRVGYVF